MRDIAVFSGSAHPELAGEICDRLRTPLHPVRMRRVAGRQVIVLDDEIARGSTLDELLNRLAEQRVLSVRIACTHGLFSHGALERLAARADVTEIVRTNTVPVPADRRPAKLTVLSIGPALAEAIRRIHEGESVSALFGHG